MAATRSFMACIDGSRAASLTAHNAAGLTVAAKKLVTKEDIALVVEASRLLRLSESCARSATAALLEVQARVKVRSHSGSVDRDAATDCGGSSGVPGAAVPGAKKKKKKKKQKHTTDAGDVLMPASTVEVAPTLPNAAPIRALKLQASRERTPPRRQQQDALAAASVSEIGRASCRERG